MNGVIVIVAYRPKPGKEKELLDLVRSRVPTLRKEGLVTDREPIIMRASDVGEILRDLRLRAVQDACGSGRNVPEFRAALIRRSTPDIRGS